MLRKVGDQKGRGMRMETNEKSWKMIAVVVGG